jgi:hypothetical protein
MEQSCPQNAELDTIRQNYAASMASQLESFRSDLTAIASDARRTIESDTRHFLNENRNLFETRTEQIRRWLTISPWVISGLIVTGIASMMAASWFWTVMLTRSELTELGLTRIDRGGADLADAGPRPDRVEDLHAGRDAGHLHQDRGGMNDDAPDSLRTRLAVLRRAVGDGLRNLSRGIERLGDTLDEEAASPVGWYRGLRDVAHTLADRVNAGVAWLAERRGHLQRAGRELERELDLSEGRRREAETELEARDREMDRRLTHGL